MAAKLTEITGVYLSGRVPCGTLFLGKVDATAGPDYPNEEITIRGNSDDLTPDQLHSGLTYRWYGQWREHPTYGRQFEVSTYVQSQPFNRAGVVRYLQLSCVGCGIGQATATALWNKFQSDAVRILREQPEVAVAATGGRWSSENATKAAGMLEIERGLEGCMQDLMGLLDARGFPRTTAKKAIQTWGNRAAEIIRRNPHTLMRYRGCGFLTTDAMYQDLGLPLNTRKRQALAAWHAIARDTNGNTWHRVEYAAMGIRERVAGTVIDPVAALVLAKRGKLLDTRRDSSNRLWVAEYSKSRAEQLVADAVAAAIAEGPGGWPEVSQVKGIDGEQPEKLGLATAGRVGVFAGSPGTGKAQPLDAVVLTPTGWKQMGTVVPGDLVAGQNGQWATVKAIFPQGEQPVFRVSFSDETSTECTTDHLWLTNTRKERQTKKTGKVRSTSEIAATLDRGDGSPNHIIPMTEPVQFPNSDLPIDPYLMGIILGDGGLSGNGVTVTNPEEFIVEAMQKALPNGCKLVQDKTNPITYRIARKETKSINHIRVVLKQFGLIGKKSTEKHIPENYLFSSTENRVALLNGLLDTDGYTDGHNIEYSTSSSQLGVGVLFLVQSLGGRVTVAIREPTYMHKGEKRVGQDSYRIVISLPNSISPFRLPRKANRYIPKSKYPPRRYIMSVEPVGKKPCQCISIDNENGLYLTNDFIVTHNTYSVGCLASLVVNLFGLVSIRVAAPTGKAAVRVTQALQSQGVQLKATTIHSMLKVGQRDEGEGWGFQHNRDNPLPFRFIIVDEASMVDASLMASLLDARAPGTHLLFVGDINQLPPVGHGAPLRDFIAAGLPYGELREIRRNSGTIVQACAEIRDGKRFHVDEEIDLESTPAKNLKAIDASNPEQQIATMLGCIEQARRAGRDPVWDCQVLVPVNAKSKVSRKEINNILQRELNKSGQGCGGSPFRVRDKIVNLKNGFFPLYEPQRQPDVETNRDGKVFVANGELGEVVAVESNKTIAKLDNPRRVILIPKGKGGDGGENGEGEASEEKKTATGCSWDLGYALSIHKSQGSEWPLVLIVLDEYPGAHMVFSREAVYTGISRAKQVCLLIGHLATAHGFCKRTALDKRKTFLVERIAEARAKLEPPRAVGAPVEDATLAAAHGHGHLVAAGNIFEEFGL